MSARLFEAATRAGIPLPPPPHDDALLAGLATRVFCHPLRGRRPPREDGYLAAARRVPLPAPAGELAAWQWGDDARPLVLLVHGWEGRGSQLGAFAAPLVSAGFKVVAFDAPAHGDSPGEETNIRLLTEALQTAVRLYGPLHAVIGHSWGAAGAAPCWRRRGTSRGAWCCWPRRSGRRAAWSGRRAGWAFRTRPRSCSSRKCGSAWGGLTSRWTCVPWPGARRVRCWCFTIPVTRTRPLRIRRNSPPCGRDRGWCRVRAAGITGFWSPPR
ncbi:MAG: alpha/beta fold hydrolase [Opitutaceae bacterium]|nr:alpha/beta fold hydrolase [Opitutaceae bacterium]